MSTTTPKWLTPERKSTLVRLFEQYGNKCLQGHTACPIASHYVYSEAIGVQVPVRIDQPCKDRDGNPLKDGQGNQLYLTLYGAKTETVNITKLARLYERIENKTIEAWKADDRLLDSLDWQAERKRLHSLGEKRYPVTGRFNNISSDIYHASQPLWYVLGQSISGVTLKSFVQVRLASSYIHLYVDLTGILKSISKNKRRKRMRYGKPLPQEIETQITSVVLKTYKDYISH